MAEDIGSKIGQMTEAVAVNTIVVRPEGREIPQPTEWPTTLGNVLDPELPPTDSNPEPGIASWEADKKISQESSFIDSVEPEQIVAIKLPDFVKEGLKVLSNKESKAKQTKELKDRLKATDEQAAKRAPEAGDAFNINKIADDESLAAWIEAGAKLDNLQDFKKMSYKDIAAKYNHPEFIVSDNGRTVHIARTQKAADDWIKRETKTLSSDNRSVPDYFITEQPVYSQEWINNFIDPSNLGKKGKTIANPVEVFKQFHFLTTVSNQAYNKGQELIVAIGNKTVSDAMRLEFQQLIVLEGILSKKLKGVQVDLARSLGILNQARAAGTVSISRLTEEALQSFGGPNAVDSFAKKYVSQKDQASRHALAEVTSNPLWRRIANIIPTTYINTLISGVPTHLKNIGGFVSLSNFSKIENFVAVGIGKTFRPGSKDRMVFEEAVSEMRLDASEWKDAWTAFYNTLKTNKTKDRATKLDARDLHGTDPFKYDVEYIGKPIEYLGIYTTLGGRVLSAEDEFMKALTFNRKIKGLAIREEVFTRQRLIDEGVDPIIASEMAEAKRIELIANPTQEMVEEGIEYARYLTQTTPLTNAYGLKKIESMTNNPALKLWTVFMRVTSNIIGSASERNPATFLFTPRVWKNIRAGGVKRDLAIARVATGSTFMYAMNTLALDGKLTGAGPFNTKDKIALEGTGWQSYSFVLERGALSEAKIKAFQAITRVSITKDKIYISYQGIEPISILLAQAATVAEYSQLYPNDGEIQDLMLYSVSASAEYVAEHPLLSGMGNIMKTLTSYDQDGDGLFDIINNATEVYIDYAVKGIPSPVGIPVTIDGKTKFVAPSQGSFFRNLEKSIRPTRSETKSPEEMEVTKYLGSPSEKIADAANRGFNEAMRKACAANPLCSDSLPDAKDPITGDSIRNGAGNLYDLWSPFKTSEGKTPGAYNVIIEYGANVPDPRKDYGVIGNVRLSASQLNTLIYYATENGKLNKSIVSYGKALLNAPGITKDQKADLINQMISEYYSAARDQLLANDSDLRLKIEETKQALVEKKEDTNSLNTLIQD